MRVRVLSQEFAGRESSERRVRPDRVVVLALGLAELSRVLRIVEQVLVEALLAHAAVEAYASG